MRNFGFLLLIGLVVYCIVDITRSDDDERAGLHPALWIVVVVLLPVLGSIVWLLVSRSQRGRRAQGGGGRAPAPGPGRGPTGPDDDPDFLWRLGQQQRRRRAAPPDPPDDDDPAPPG